MVTEVLEVQNLSITSFLNQIHILYVNDLKHLANSHYWPTCKHRLDFFGSFLCQDKNECEILSITFLFMVFIILWILNSYTFQGREQKSNQKTLVFDFRRSKLVSVIQYFKSFAPQTVKHFNHLLQLFDTRLQIIWRFHNPFSNT